MSNILPEILAEILSRVPAKSLLRFRCVSKQWRALIDCKGFIKMHLNRTIETDSDRKLVLQNLSPVQWESYFAWAEFDGIEKGNEVEHKELDHPLRKPYATTMIVGSCHGLLCLYRDNHNIAIWNPTTRKHLKIPYSKYEYEFPKESTREFVVRGFGYDRASDDYKLMRILQSEFGCGEVKIFSVKSHSWRRVGLFPYHLKYADVHGVAAEGALHWLAIRDPKLEPTESVNNLIVAFDLESEEYRFVPLPDIPNTTSMYLVVLRKSLSVFCDHYDYSSCPYFDIWSMNEYGVDESWAKIFRITKDRITPLRYVAPLACSKNGNKLFMIEDSMPLWYDPEQEKIRYLSFTPAIDPLIVKNHMCFGSLVQLDRGISDTVTEVQNSNGAGDSHDTNKKSKKKRYI